MPFFRESITTATYPAIAVEDMVIYPHITASLEVEEKSLVSFLKKAGRASRKVVIANLKDAEKDFNVDNIHGVGMLVNVKQIIPGKDDAPDTLIIEGSHRVDIKAVNSAEKINYCDVEVREIIEVNEQKNEMAVRLIRNLIDHYEDFFLKAPQDYMDAINSIEDASLLCDYVTSFIAYKTEDKLAVLAEYDVFKRIEILQGIFTNEKVNFTLEKELFEKVQSKLANSQKENFLREQMRIISAELGDDDEDELLKAINDAPLPDEVRQKLEKEYSKLSKLAIGSPENAIINNYIETCLELPWGKYTKDNLNIAKASKILERDHYGLKKVKGRILEFIAVKKLSSDLGGQILCLVGPPGVGKTSIAKSIAEALGRNYVRASLGGVRDEADIRGHRKTYVGAMPGRIITALKQSGSMNPLFLLDEVDKLTRDAHGDPSSALLEVLDSEQNNSFRDHFIELPVDLSQCMFIATANTVDTIPRPLLDRMEVIEVPSYTMTEKLHIAKKYLLPKQMKRHGIPKAALSVSDTAIKELIDGYTRESGVRNLEREIAHLCRVIAKNIVTENAEKYSIGKGEITEYIGKYKVKPKKFDKQSRVGVVNGLAWTQVGGEMLEVEATSFAGSGKLEITGSLGDVMIESAKLAVSICRARAEELGVKNLDFYKNSDIHIHVPEGAVPKDGPSAGITITTALVSELTGIPVRSDVAMTGEITLRGEVLPIGGLREKTMAAYANGIKTVIVPIGNLDDLNEIDDIVKESINIIGVSSFKDALRVALDK